MNRKHNSDGHPRQATNSDIKIGTVIRRVNTDGGVSSFSDTVVIGIKTTDWKDTRNDKWYESAVGIHERVWGDTIITVARPYLYANSVGCCPNWLQGCEQFTMSLKQLLESYSVVEMSTGELDIRNV